MRRAFWFGALVFALTGMQCTSSSGEGTGGDDSFDAGLPSFDAGGTSEDAGAPDTGPADKTPPTFAGIKSATALSETQVGVTWEPATDDHTAQGTIAYRIYVGSAAGGETFTAPVVVAPAGATGATIAGLHAFQKYFFVVRAVDSSGNEDANVVEASASTLDVTAPTFGGAKTVTGTDAHEVKVTWDPATDNGSAASAVHYDVFASSTQGGENFSSVSVSTAAGATFATVTGLPEAAKVFVIVRAVDESGNHDNNMHEVSGITLDKTPPTFSGLASATTVGTTINLAWADATDNVDTAAGIKYDIFQSTTPGGENFATPTFTTDLGATSFAVTNLSVSTKYYFVVRAHDSANNVDVNTIEKSSTTAASPDVKPPTFAGLVTAVATTDQTIDLSWAAASDDYAQPTEIVYDIFQSTSPGGEAFGAPTATTVAGATNFTVSGLLPVTKYYFVVRARDLAGNQDTNAIEKSATTLADTIPPTFAGLVSATALGPTSIQLSWAPASDDISSAANIKYRVFQAASAGGEAYGSPTINVAAGQTSVVVNGLQPATPYYFVVRAVDEAGNSDTNKLEKNVSTDADVTAPTFGGATGLVSLSATSVTVSWSPATDDVTPSSGIVYLPFLSTTPGGEAFGTPPTPTAPNATSYTFNGLTPNTTYYVVVRAKDVAGNIDTNTTEVSVKSQPDTTPPTFAGASNVGSATDQSLKVSWAAATDNSTPQANLTYLVCMTTTAGGCNGGSFTTTVTIPNGGTNTTFTGLTPSTTYYFVVRAKDAYGNTDTNSVQVSGATIADLVAPTFAGLVTAASNSPTSIDLSWAAGTDDLNSPSQLVYDVYQSATLGGENYLGATYTTAAGATSYKVNGLLPGAKWYFVVRARDQNGNHDSNVVEKTATVQNDTTAPTFGGVTSVTATGLTSLHVAWNAATDNVTPQNQIVYYVCWNTSATACTSAFATNGTSAAGATSFDIAGLLANTNYTVVVRAHDTYNNTDTNVVAITTKTNADVTAPTFAGNPQVIGATATTLTLQWAQATDNYSPQATLQYLVCMSTNPATCTGAFAPTVTLTNQLSYTFNSLVNLQTYYFVVRAKDQAGNVDTNVNQVSAQTVSDSTAPTFAGLSTATVQSDSTIQLAWSAATDNVSTAGQIVYDIYQAASAGGESYAAPSYTSAPGATGYLVTGLTPNTNYYFVVRARDVAGNRDTNVVEKTAKTNLDLVAPTFAGVTGVNVISDSQLQAVWAAATDDTTASAAIKYQVCWAIGNGCTTSFSAMATTAAGATSYTTAVRTLVPNTTYTFVVRAVDAYNNVDGNTATASATTLVDNIPPTFAGASSVSGLTYKTATVNWAAATDDYTVAANMQYAICVTTTNGGCNDASFSATATVTNQTSYSFPALLPNTTYYFVVRAKDQAGNFNTTNQNVQVTATTPQEANAPVFAGLASAGSPTSSSIALSWAAATDDYSSAVQITYNVYVATSPGGQNYLAPNATVAGVAGTNNYTFTGLSPGTAYYFVVRAKDLAGNTDTNTVEKSATTLPTAPTFSPQPTASSITTSSFFLSWGASSTPASTISYEYCVTTVNGACNNFAAGTGTSTGTTASASVTGRAAYTTYYFVVRASNTGGSTYSSQGSVLTNPTPPTMSSIFCNSAHVVSGTADFYYPYNAYPHYANIMWSAATPGSLPLASAPAYDVCYSTSSCSCGNGVGCGSFSVTQTATGNVNGAYLSWYMGTAAPLTANTTYYFRMRARDQIGTTSNIVSVACTTPISATDNVNPWWTTNCNGCHTGTTYPGPWSGAYFVSSNSSAYCAGGYVYIDKTSFSLGGSYIYTKTHSTPPPCGVLMPQGAVTPIDTSLMNTWIRQGARNN